MVTRSVLRSSVMAALAMMLFLCSGCMYRGEIERQQGNPAFIREEIDRVTSAVERYYKARGVYPIKNSDESISVYEKYVIDLNRLVQAQMLSSIPGNAFESGGHYYYLLVHPETKPVVMLMDLLALQQAADLQKAVNRFMKENGGVLPIEAVASNGFFAINYAALKVKPLQIQSAYTHQFLPVLLHKSGEVLIDYSLDIMEAARQAKDDPLEEGEDAREWLTKASPISPVLSYPYIWTNGEPVLVPPHE